MEDVLGQSPAPSGGKSGISHILNRIGTASLKFGVFSVAFGFFSLTFLFATLIDIFLYNGSDDGARKRLMRPVWDQNPLTLQFFRARYCYKCSSSEVKRETRIPMASYLLDCLLTST